MADFINFEAEADFINPEDAKQNGKKDDDEVSDISDVDSENSFIDNEEVQTDVNFYRHFANVENDIEQVLKDAHNEVLEDIDRLDEISNLCNGSEDEAETDDFKNFEIDIQKFKDTLFPRVDAENEKIENQFCKAILYALRFHKNGLMDVCNNEDFEKITDKNLIQEISQPKKIKSIIELQKFINMCYEISPILAKHNYFLRVFELKNNFRQFEMKDKNKREIVRQLSSCLIEKYSSFTIISIEYQKKQRKLFKLIDIIYKPTKHIEIEPLCYFSDDISKAYSSLHLNGKKGLSRAHKCYQCYCRNKFFILKLRQKRHMENFSGRPEVVYNFNNQNLISYQDNFRAKGDIPFTIYSDFETTAPTDNCLDPEQKKMFVVSYVMIVAFHPDLHLDRIITQRCFAHSLEQLTTLDYFCREQITFIEPHLIKMLKDMAFEVSKRSCKNSIGQMFSIESALIKKTLLK